MWEQFFTPSEVTIIIRIVVAVILGIIIGLQREVRKVVSHFYGSAGLRTHALVSLGAALISSIGVIYFPSDPIRLAASIMTGIGFIGAGTIIASSKKIRGLTTATSIWTVAAIGMAVGIGSYAGAIVATILVLIILELWMFEKREKTTGDEKINKRNL